MSGTRVLVAGASIAGPALAHWLRRRRAEVTVVERAPGLRPGGHTRLQTLTRAQLEPLVARARALQAS